MRCNEMKSSHCYWRFGQNRVPLMRLYLKNERSKDIALSFMTATINLQYKFNPIDSNAIILILHKLKLW